MCEEDSANMWEKDSATCVKRTVQQGWHDKDDVRWSEKDNAKVSDDELYERERENDSARQRVRERTKISRARKNDSARQRVRERTEISIYLKLRETQGIGTQGRGVQIITVFT